MKHRLFIALDLPMAAKSALRDEVFELKEKFSQGIRFMPEENWHVTLLFLGDQDDAKIPAIIEAMREACYRESVIRAEIARVEYGPHNKEPRMIWAENSGGTSARMGELRDKLMEALFIRKVSVPPEFKRFNGHITLARLPRVVEFLPQIQKNISIKFNVSGLDLVESDLRSDGSAYTLLQSIDFEGDSERQ